MHCRDCEDLLSDYLDDDVAPDQKVEIENHLVGCERCSSLCDELGRLIASGRALAPQISGPTISTRTVASPRRPPVTPLGIRWWKQRLFERYVEIRLTLPQFAAVCALVVVIAGFGVRGLFSPAVSPNSTLGTGTEGGVRGVPDGFAEDTRTERAVLLDSIDRLSRSLEQRKPNWNPELRKVFERNMVLIDQSLNECETALRTNPRDAEAEEMMLAAYREKLRLLQEFAAI